MNVINDEVNKLKLKKREQELLLTYKQVIEDQIINLSNITEYKTGNYLNTDLYNNIVNHAPLYEIGEPITIIIHEDLTLEDFKETLERTLVRNIRDLHKRRRYIYKITILYALFGIAFYLLAGLQLFKDNTMVNYAIMIASWVFFSAIIDKLFFVRNNLISLNYKLVTISNASIIHPIK